MYGKKFPAIGLLIFALVLIFAPARGTKGQDSDNKDKQNAYPVMAPLDQYLMDRNAEIALARSAAPETLSRDATVLVLGRHGYETAIEGKNGFVCVVERSWMLPYDDSEFWNPSVRLPLCQNPPAARSHLPITFKTTELAWAGMSKTQMFDSIKDAFAKKKLPPPEHGSMCYMMSKQQNFGPKFGNAGPHLMFWFPQGDHVTWGADLADSPVDVHQYSPQPITEFTISVSKWSDGTTTRASQH